MTNLIASVELKNGIVVEFLDQSNRYYGDFHRVKIDAIAKIPVSTAQMPEELQSLAESCEGEITYERSLEKMGVKSADIESVTRSLIDNFVETVGSYLEKEHFAESLLRKQLGVHK